jgi:hypothetical protein
MGLFRFNFSYKITIRYCVNAIFKKLSYYDNIVQMGSRRPRTLGGGVGCTSQSRQSAAVSQFFSTMSAGSQLSDSATPSGIVEKIITYQ